MVGLRLFAAAILVVCFLAASYRVLADAAKVSLPEVIVNTTVETRGSSRDPSQNATTFQQLFKLAPYELALTLPGAAVRSSFSFLSRVEGEDLPLLGGKALTEHEFAVGMQDLYRHWGLSASSKDRLALQPAGSAGALTRADTVSEQSFSLALAPPGGPALSATVSRAATANVYAGRLASGSEWVTGSFSAQHTFSRGSLRLNRSISESVTVPGGNESSTETTLLSFDHAAALPLGTLKTAYSYKESASDFLVAPGETSVSQEEYLRTGLEGKALHDSFDYSASTEQRRITAPDRSLSETQTQQFAAGVSFPLAGEGSGRAGAAVSHSQATGTTSDITTASVKYSLTLQPVEELSLGVSSEHQDRTDRRVQSGHTASSSLSGNLRYAPHPNFNLSATISEASSRDFRGSGSEQSRHAVSLSATMSAQKRFNLSFQLGDSSSQDVSQRLFGDREDDAFFAAASLNFRPSPQLALNASLRSNVYHRRPGDRESTQALTLTMNYQLTESLWWQFIYRGDDRRVRQDPASVNYGDTIQTSFQFTF